MTNTTYVARINCPDGFTTRNSATMAYTHAVVLLSPTGEESVLSWHKSEDNANAKLRSSETTYWIKDGVTARVIPVEAHAGGKAKVERALKLAAEAQATDMADVAKDLNAALTDPALVTPAKATPAKATPAKEAPAKKAATAGVRSVPTEAANPVRQKALAEVGIDKYRNQYNGGWDAATAGAGVKKAASGTAPVAWMDGFNDRTANPGKAGIAAKWSALRSTEAPVLKVEAPAPAEAPAEAAQEKAEKAPSAPAKAPAKAKAKRTSAKAAKATTKA